MIDDGTLTDLADLRRHLLVAADAVVVAATTDARGAVRARVRRGRARRLGAGVPVLVAVLALVAAVLALPGSPRRDGSVATVDVGGERSADAFAELAPDAPPRAGSTLSPAAPAAPAVPGRDRAGSVATPRGGSTSHPGAVDGTTSPAGLPTAPPPSAPGPESPLAVSGPAAAADPPSADTPSALGAPGVAASEPQPAGPVPAPPPAAGGAAPGAAPAGSPSMSPLPASAAAFADAVASSAASVVAAAAAPVTAVVAGVTDTRAQPTDDRGGSLVPPGDTDLGGWVSYASSVLGGPAGR